MTIDLSQDLNRSNHNDPERPLAIPSRRSLFMIVFLLGPVFSAPTASALSFEFWPLVESADEAVWGTVSSMEVGERDRLFTIDVHGRADLAVSGGYGQLQVLERCGRYPERTPLHPGDTGLFLIQFPPDTSGEWPHPDGWLVAGGFLRAPAEASDHGLITQLVQRDFTDELRRPHEALLLLASESIDCRRIALEWLRRSSFELTGNQPAQLTTAFRSETDARNLYLFLDLFLVRKWDYAGSGISNLVLTRSEPDVNALALHYRTRYRDARDEADLLAAYPTADTETRCRLLKAYAALGIEESQPWWDDALLSADSRLFTTAVRELGRTEVPHAVETLELLLMSESNQTRQSALRSLAARGDHASYSALSTFLANEPNSSLRNQVQSIMKHPFRYSRVPFRDQRDE